MILTSVIYLEISFKFPSANYLRIPSEICSMFFFSISLKICWKLTSIVILKIFVFVFRKIIWKISRKFQNYYYSSSSGNSFCNSDRYLFEIVFSSLFGCFFAISVEVYLKLLWKFLRFFSVICMHGQIMWWIEIYFGYLL